MAVTDDDVSETTLVAGFDVGGDTVEDEEVWSLVVSFASSVAFTALMVAVAVTDAVALGDVVADAFDAATAGVLAVVPEVAGAVIAGPSAGPVALLVTDSVGNDTNGPSRRSKFKAAEVNVFMRSSTSIFCVK